MKTTRIAISLAIALAFAGLGMAQSNTAEKPAPPAEGKSSTEAKKPKFSIGSEAPDIVGVDQEGKEFKLSDYRGKVVLLDFWGYW